LNNCDDHSAEIVNAASTRHDGLRLHVVDVRFPPPWAHVASARRLAMERALNIGGPHSVLFSTEHRDATAILVAYRHGLRASEVVVLRWDDIDLTTGRLHVRRAKSGDASVHPISARESRALRKLLREAPTSPYVFISERRAPLSAAGYQRTVARAGVAAKFTFLVHSHMLRHACGFKLANDGHETRAIQAYLGHRSIMSTVRYTALTPNRFKHFWKD
jgi:type 1 fimbriae regulatory protein FimE